MVERERCGQRARETGRERERDFYFFPRFDYVGCPVDVSARSTRGDPFLHIDPIND